MTAYPQKPPLTQHELVAFLNEAPIARLSSMNPDGTIHMAAADFKYDQGDILIGTQDITHRKPPNTAPLRGIPCGHDVYDVHLIPDNPSIER